MSQSLQLWRRNDAALDLRNYRHPDRADMGGGADVYERWGSGMTDWREELIEKMALVMFEYVEEQSRLRFRDVARAALAVAEPVIREQEDNALRKENARLREALKDLIEEDEYQTCSGEEEDGIARAAARASIREGEKNE